MLKIITTSIFLLLISSQIIAQKNSFEADFIKLELFAKQADYKGGLFYAKKLNASLAKKDSEINRLRSACFLRYFSEMLDKKIELETAQKLIQQYLPALSKPENKHILASTFSIYADYYVQRGQYIVIDSAIQLLKPLLTLLPTFDRERIHYYELVSLFNKGFLNNVIRQTDAHLNTVLIGLKEDTLFDAQNGSSIISGLSINNKSLRTNLISDLILLKGNAYLKNGFSDSALIYLQSKEAFISKREGNNAQYHYLIGMCHLSNNDYHLAEKEFKTASSLSLRFFYAQAPEQIAIETGLVQSLTSQGKKEEAEYYKNDITIKITGYFNKNNIVYIQNMYSEIEYSIVHQDWKDAEVVLKKFLREPNLPEIHFIRANYLKTLAQIFIEQQKYEEAENTFQDFFSLQNKLTGNKCPTYQIAILDQARFYSFNLDKFKEAKILFASVLDSDFKDNISLENPNYYLNTLAFSKLYVYTEEFDISENILKTYLKKVDSSFGPTHDLYAVYLSHIGELKTIKGDFTDANTNLVNSISIFEKNNKKKYVRRYIEALELYLKLKVIEGDYEAADQLLKKAKKIGEQVYIYETDEIFLLEEIGLLYSKKGEFQKANKILSSILKSKVQSVGETHKSICNTLNYLGEQNLIVGNYAEADDYFNRSVQITKNIYGEKSIPYATSLLYYTQLYSAIGDYEKAESSIQEALEIYTKRYGEKNINTGVLMHKYALATFQADIYTSRKNKTTHTELEKQFSNSLEILKITESDNFILYAEGLEDYAIYLALTNQYTAALSNIEIAKKVWENKIGKINIHSAQLNNLSGKIYYKSGRYSEALLAFEKSRNEYKEIFDDNHPGYVGALGSCAQMYYILGNTSKAIESIEECTNKSLVYIDKVFPFLSERGKMAYWDKIKDDFEFYKTVAFVHAAEKPEMIGKILNIQLQTKSILLNSQLKIKNEIYGNGDTTAIHLYQEWFDTRDNLAFAYSLNAVQRKEEKIDIVVLESKLETLEKSLSMYSDYFSSQTKNKSIQYTWKSLKQNLSENEVAIETIPFRLFTKSFSDTIWYGFVAVANNSTIPSYVIEKNGKNLEKRNLNYHRNMIKFKHVDTLSYDEYWKLIATLIKPNYTTIYFAADGVYSQLNVETLRDPNGQFLINSSNIQYIGSSRDIITKNIKQPNAEKKSDMQFKEIDLIGNPTYYSNENDGMIDQLPGSEKEVRSINSIVSKKNWKTNIYIGTDATEDTVKAIKSPYVLHLSTHGFFWQENTTNIQNELAEASISNPLLMSGILLYNGGELINTKNINSINKSPGILTAYEAMNLSLDKTDLVVLSACETGLGEIKIGEGVYGLQRSFTVAGAKTIIMSLSKVSDEVTTKLMEKFYTNWLETGNKREAFIQAKKDLMLEYPDPKYWGAFILIGI